MKSFFKNRGARTFQPIRQARGFSMIEILVAMVLLAIGLLGFALLQTMNLRYATSANQRTQATNLAYELLDVIRTNRVLVSRFTTMTTGSFAGVPDQNCVTGAIVGVVLLPADSMAAWRCQVRSALGNDAWAQVTQPNPGVVNVVIQWNDQRWTPGDENRQVVVTTRL